MNLAISLPSSPVGRCPAVQIRGHRSREEKLEQARADFLLVEQRRARERDQKKRRVAPPSISA